MTLFGDLELETDLAAAVAALDEPCRREPTFSLGRNLFHAKKAAERKARRGIKKFIRPENADPVLGHLPETPDDRTHCVLRGDFVLCDLIPRIIAFRGYCPHLRIATLGMSLSNATTLAELVGRGAVGALTVIVSHYFQQVDKATTFAAVSAALANCGRLAVTRSHAKVILIPTAAGDHFTLEGSANLRSSDNVEQMMITNDVETHNFHAAWLDELAAA